MACLQTSLLGRSVKLLELIISPPTKWQYDELLGMVGKTGEIVVVSCSHGLDLFVLLPGGKVPVSTAWFKYEILTQ